METDRRAFLFNNTKCSCEILRRAHKGTIIKIPGIQRDTWDLGSDVFGNWMESQGEAQRAQGVSLLYSAAAVNGVLTQIEERLA